MTSSKHLATLCLFSLALGCIGCQANSDPTASKDAKRDAASALDRVTVGLAIRKTLKLYTQQPGRIVAFEQTPVFSKIAGYVEAVQVDIGDRVVKGQLLIQLTVPEYKNELEQKLGLLALAEAEVQQAEAALVAIEAAASSAKSMVVQATASIGRAEGDYARWDSERKRMAQLVNTGAVTAKLGDETLNNFRAAEASKQEALASVGTAQARLQEAEANIITANAELTTAKARIRVAQANVQQAETMLNYTQLTAPFDGIITHRDVDTGHYVHPASASSSKPLVVIASTEQVRVFVDIPEMEAPLVDAGYGDEQAGDTASIRPQSLNDQTFEARITRSSWSLDPHNRSLTAEIDLPNTDNKLLPGSYATVSILLQQRDDVLTLPITAIYREGQVDYCCVVVSGKIERRPLKLGLRSGGEVEIVSGLDGTEAVVLFRSAALQVGQIVEVIVKE